MSGLRRFFSSAVAFAFALVAGLVVSGCLYSCPDYSDYLFELEDGSYETSRSGEVSTLGDYVIESAPEVDIDAAEQTVTVSFLSEGRRVSLTYDVVDFQPPG